MFRSLVAFFQKVIWPARVSLCHPLAFASYSSLKLQRRYYWNTILPHLLPLPWVPLGPPDSSTWLQYNWTESGIFQQRQKEWSPSSLDHEVQNPQIVPTKSTHKKKKKRSTHNFPSPKTEVCKIQTKRSHLSKRFLIPPPKHPPAHATFAVRNQSCSETVLSGQTQVVGDMADDRLRLILTVLSLDLRNTLVFTTKVTMVSKPRLAKFLWSRDQFIIFLFITSVPLFWELSVVRESPLKTMTIYGKKKKKLRIHLPNKLYSHKITILWLFHSWLLKIISPLA